MHACSRRTPTTWSSTSRHRTPPACAVSRPSTGWPPSSRRYAGWPTRPRGAPVPLCVKIAPDLADDDVVDVAELARSQGLDGIIATNTTISRDGLRTDPAAVEALGPGGLSGPVLRKRSLEVLRILRAHDREIALVSVGGITGVDDARGRLHAGADLVQAYTGFVYGGPLWPRRIVAGLAGLAG